MPNWTPDQLADYCRRQGQPVPGVPGPVPPPEVVNLTLPSADFREEKAIQTVFLQWLQHHEIPHIWQAMNRKSHLPPGWPDFSVLLPQGRLLLVETKAEHGRLSADQQECHETLLRAGHEVHVLRSAAECITLTRNLLNELSAAPASR